MSPTTALQALERLVESLGRLVARLAEPATWSVLAAVAAIYVICQRSWAWYRLRHIDGPFLASLTDFWLIRKTWRGETFAELGRVCQEYGPVARIAPNYVVCGDPLEVRRMWGVRSQFDRAQWYKGFQLDPPRDCTLSMRDNDIHTALRSKLSPGYSGKDVEGLHESIDDGIARFVRLIDEKYLSTHSEYRPVDFARKVQFMTLDIISKVAFGKAFGFMDQDDDLFGYIKQTEDSLPIMQMAALIPWLIGLLQSPLCKPMMPSDKDVVGLGPVIRVGKQVVAERFGQNKIDRKDMLGSFVRHGLDRKDAESESLVQIIAGSDTTATALRSILVHIITNPLIHKRLLAEIDTGASEGKISRPITDAEARKLPFLQACIKEGFRVWPPITGIMPRISDRDAVLCGKQIPAGTNVAWSAWAVLRNKELFGDDAGLYRPERWLLDDSEKLAAMDGTVDLCFGQGRWGCLGRPIALVELNKMIVELLRRYDFAVVNPAAPIKNDFFGVLIQSELYLRISRRTTDED